MDIRTLRYFVEVVRQQSFTRAAERLFVTQPTISKMLKKPGGGPKHHPADPRWTQAPAHRYRPGGV